MGVGGSGVKVVNALGAGGAAAVADAAAAARVSGDLARTKIALAEKAPVSGQVGLRRSPSVRYTAGVERAGWPNGRNREANEGAPVTFVV